jgi:thiamine-monophosphate kinase
MGEFDLLARIRERLPEPGARLRLGSGDDAAVTVPGGATATSVDALVEGVHFRRQSSSLEQIGGKALAVALSDLAAMGAEPGEAYVVLGIPRDLNEEGCLDLLSGIERVAAETGTELAGGDVTRAPVLTLSVTVVGHAEQPEDFVTRSGARPGDALVVTGELGGAAAGLLLLERESGMPVERGPYGHRSTGTPAALIARQLEPRPQLQAGRALAKAGATAMIDLSDGLGGDARHLAEESGVALRIDADALPLAAGLDGVTAPPGSNAAEHDPLELAVSGGEDYELLAALPVDKLPTATAAVAEHGGLTRIGTALAGEGVEIRLPGGELLAASGFDQLS